IIIIAAVVLLAASAAFLSWRNLHGKDAPQAKAEVSSPAATASGPAIEASKLESAKPSPATQEQVSEITPGSENPGSHASKPTSASKPATPEPAPAAQEPEVTQRLIVRNEATPPVKSAAAPDQEPVQAPSAIGGGEAADPKALASISSAPGMVPNPSAQVVRVSQGVMEGLVLKRVPPRYPTQALQMRIQGSVQL